MSDIPKIMRINIIDDKENNIFDFYYDHDFNPDKNKYIIPLYQRAFAWGDKELNQLIDDIDGIDPTKDVEYCIGTLIVANRTNEAYEVVDGQQRLTALFILLNCLGLTVQSTLEFECREKSKYTFEHIKDIIIDNKDLDNPVDMGIFNGIKCLKQKLNSTTEIIDKTTEIIDKLKKVVIYRIEVPEHTDLNRYFETMNTRGEQLEQHDILKSVLMSNLEEEEQKLFADIWEACSDMSGYVQMHFKKELREKLFGSEWSDIPFNGKQWVDVVNEIRVQEEKQDGNKDKNTESTDANNIQNQGGKSITDLIDPNFKKNNQDNKSDNENDEKINRYESIIDFPYFLLHTLKVMNTTNKINANIPDSLDDKKLLEVFVLELNKYCENYEQKEKEEKEAEFSRKFIVCLLRTRFFFDKYIIKRAYSSKNQDGEWTLKKLKKTYGKLERANIDKTEFIKLCEPNQNTQSEKRNKENIMIQSALRVSYTSPKTMHWITKLLIHITENHIFNGAIAEGYAERTAEIAKEPVKKFLEAKNFKQGVSTPHIVFNYLDYLLWKEDYKKDEKNREYKDFTFEFRNSVEHWYPQHPSEGTFDSWDDVDTFGNLCLIPRSVNSRFSNMSPEAKNTTLKDKKNNISLKLKLMSEATTSETDWKEAYIKHEDDMLKKLCDACGKDWEQVKPLRAENEKTE